jgi:hypothetical protein
VFKPLRKPKKTHHRTVGHYCSADLCEQSYLLRTQPRTAQDVSSTPVCMHLVSAWYIRACSGRVAVLAEATCTRAVRLAQGQPMSGRPHMQPNHRQLRCLGSCSAPIACFARYAVRFGFDSLAGVSWCTIKPNALRPAIRFANVPFAFMSLPVNVAAPNQVSQARFLWQPEPENIRSARVESSAAPAPPVRPSASIDKVCHIVRGVARRL